MFVKGENDMEYSFKDFLKSAIKTAKIPFIVLAACTVLCLAFAASGAPIGALVLNAFCFSVLSGCACFICIFVSMIIKYYKAIHKSGIAAYNKPLVPILGAILSNLLLCAITALFLFSSVVSTAISADKYLDELETEESVSESDSTAEELINIQNIIKSKGYNDIGYFLSFAFYSIIKYISALSIVICAISYAKIFRGRPLLGSIMGIFLFSTANSIISDLLFSLTSKAAPGITAVVAEINAFYETLGNSGNPVSLLDGVLKNYAQIPAASAFQKLYIFTSLCYMICIITMILISKVVVSKDLTPKIQSDNKNNI